MSAAGGTLLLIDINLLTPRLQERLLAVLESGMIEIAGTKPVAFDARVIATVRRNLIESVARGEFSEALYLRLRTNEIVMPPLRDRRQDIPAIAERMRHRIKDRLQLSVKQIDDEAMRLLEEFGWPGNIVQLEKTLESAFVSCAACVVRAEHLPIELRDASGDANNSRRARDDAQRFELIEVLNWAGWNKSKAARKLGISRETLYRRMEKFELSDHEHA
jgi:two-component system response regulator AtoC